MSTTYCEACAELREDNADFVANGIDDEMCASLANNTGLTASVGNNTAYDLTNMNSCLIGGLELEIDSYDTCDWQTFMENATPNVRAMFEAIICSISGMWERIEAIEAALDESE